jgi:hypothetical protein
MATAPEIFMHHASPVGYGALVDRHELCVVRPDRWTFLANHGGERIEPDRVALRLPHVDPRQMSDLDHLLFALKHEGVFLPVLDAYVEKVGALELEAELTASIRAHPTSKYVRVAWFLYEWLTGRTLPVPDLETGNYVQVLNLDRYLGGPPRRVRRQRVLDNLLGSRAFCPFVRRAEELMSRSAAALREAMETVIASYDPSVLGRALSFLYTKETMSSFAIERETPSPQRAEKFARLLRRVDDVRTLDEPTLTELQNAIVDPRFAEPGYREKQNYVGETSIPVRQLIHFVPPRPDALRVLMEGWQRTAAELMREDSPVDPVVAAACVAFGFVYLHPFIDGNGRLHRFIVHQLLARRRVTPPGFIVPVSAVMLSRRAEYDACLESFSKPLLDALDFEIDEEGCLSVTQDSRRHYRFIDMTAQAIHLYRWLELAVREELPGELDFLVGLDRTRDAMRAVVDLPDRLADLFVKVVLQNGGRLSQAKRASHFHQLSDAEIARLEGVIARNMPLRSFGTAAPRRP